jgi:alpha/beta superfamily hydrolase
MTSERAFTIESDGLRLEGALHEGGGELLAVVLHPHPQYDGDMHNQVVTAVCGALAERGATTLRFNFRGAGRSEGAFDSGRGEANDARAAVAAMHALRPDGRLLLAGYSFGAMIAAAVATDVRPDALVLISPPLGMMPTPLHGEPAAAIDPELRTLLITGEDDRIAPPDALRALDAPNRTIVVVPGVDHGWWPGLDEITRAVEAFARAALPTAR